MPYYQNPEYILQDGILTIPVDSQKTIADMRLFSYKMPGKNVVSVDNPTDITKMLRGTMEDLLSILGLTKNKIKMMKKRELIEYLQPRIVFQE